MSYLHKIRDRLDSETIAELDAKMAADERKPFWRLRLAELARFSWDRHTLEWYVHGPQCVGKSGIAEGKSEAKRVAREHLIDERNYRRELWESTKKERGWD